MDAGGGPEFDHHAAPVIGEKMFKKKGQANKINMSTMSLTVDSLRTSSFSRMVNAKLERHV